MTVSAGWQRSWGTSAAWPKGCTGAFETEARALEVHDGEHVLVLEAVERCLELVAVHIALDRATGEPERTGVPNWTEQPQAKGC